MRRALRYLQMRLAVQLAYRGDLVMHLLSDLLITAVGLVMVVTIFQHVPTVAGWSVHEVLLGWGFAEASLGLYWVLFQGLVVFNRRYLLEGGLDRVLLRPISPYLQVLLDHLNLDALPVVGLGLAVVAVGALGLGIPWTLAQWLMLPLFVLGGALLVGGMFTGLTALGFWVQHQGSLVGLAYQFTTYSRYPMDFFPRPLSLIFTYVVPLAFIGFLPATFYMDRPEWWGLAVLQPLVAGACLLLGVGAWNLGLSRYESAGS